jgi:anthranilate synthase component 1
MVGAQLSMEIVAKENQITVLDYEEDTWVEKTSEDPLGEPSEIASNWQPVPIDGFPDVFCGESPNSFALLTPLDVKPEA